MIPFSGQMLQSMFEFIIIVMSLWNRIASIQSSAPSRWASGFSPGSPLNMGGGILTQGLDIIFIS